MSWITTFLSSTIGKKLIMALTGLFLCSFLVVHLIGNLQLFYKDEGLAFNQYAVFMTSFPLIKFISYGLYAFILLHAFDGISLAIRNRKARPVRYAEVNNQSTWASRNMTMLGTVLLVYLIVHMSNFWFQYKFGYVPYRQYEENLTTGQIVSKSYFDAESRELSKSSDAALAVGPAIKGKQEEYVRDGESGEKIRVTIVKDLYAEVEESFKNPLLVLLYVFGMVALAYHLVHGFQSAFQTLGLNHPKYNPLIRFLSVGVFAIAIPIGFAAMPIYFYVKSLS
jgi:succinate dehydrogenase / fumarate reductase cytochrome b subunit